MRKGSGLYRRQDVKDEEQLYGELDTDSWVTLIDKLEFHNQVVLDIGSGGADFIAHGAKLLPDTKFIGIEFVNHRHKYALKFNNKLDNLILVNDKYPCNIPFNPSIVIIHGCAFSNESIKNIYKNIPKGCRVIHNSLVMHRLHDDDQKLLLRTSYSKKVYFYIFTK